MSLTFTLLQYLLIVGLSALTIYNRRKGNTKLFHRTFLMTHLAILLWLIDSEWMRRSGILQLVLVAGVFILWFIVAIYFTHKERQMSGDD